MDSAGIVTLPSSSSNHTQMLKVIRESYEELIEDYQLFFETKKGSGYSFPCDKDGNVKPLSDVAIPNYEKCISGDIATIRPAYVQDWSRTYRHPKVCKCHCGRELEMYGDGEGLVYCECNRCYNTAGQSIRPRYEWVEQYEDDY